MTIDYVKSPVWVKLTHTGEESFQGYLEKFFPRGCARNLAELGYRVPNQGQWIKLDIRTLGEMFIGEHGLYEPFEDGEVHLTCPFD